MEVMPTPLGYYILLGLIGEVGLVRENRNQGNTVILRLEYIYVGR